MIGKLSDSFGRRNIMLVCFFYNVVGNTVLFLGQTPIMDHAPWFWIWMALGVVNLWGGVGSAYLADIMPPEWRSIAFVSPAAICKGPSHLTRRGRLRPTGDQRLHLRDREYAGPAHRSHPLSRHDAVPYQLRGAVCHHDVDQLADVPDRGVFLGRDAAERAPRPLHFHIAQQVK